MSDFWTAKKELELKLNKCGVIKLGYNKSRSQQIHGYFVKEFL